LDPYGKVDLKATEPGASENLYAFSSPREVLRNMETIAKRWEKVQPRNPGEEALPEDEEDEDDEDDEEDEDDEGEL